MLERISVKDFKEKFGGDLDKLRHKLAVTSKPNKRLSDAEESSETPKKKKYEYREFKLQVQVAKLLTLKYPYALFESSPINLNLTPAQRQMMSAIQKPGFHPPDIKIYLARRGYVGFALELKQESPFLQDGVTLQNNKHLKDQQESIDRLRAENWLAGFYWNFDTIQAAFEWYFEKV